MTTAQINELAERYELDQVGIQDISTLQPLLNLVGGHPYLLQLSFYWLRSKALSLTQLLQEAPTTRGIYSEYLRRLWSTVQRDGSLMAGLQQVLFSSEPTPLDLKIAYQLENLGLVQLSGVKVSLCCELYRQYFHTYLET